MDGTLRPLTDADVDPAREVQIAAFDTHDRERGDPIPAMSPERIEAQRRRIRHFLAHDLPGSWVYEQDGRVVGVGLALRRDNLWGLSLLVVEPGLQSRGIGRALLDATLGYAKPDDMAVILSSSDPRALRRYASAGFALYPQIRASGTVDRRLLPPASPRVRIGGPDFIDMANAVDVVVRGATRGPDHELLTAVYAPMFVVDDAAGRGYVYPSLTGGVYLLAATDDATATDLLWACLAHDVELGLESAVDHVNAEQQWAVEVVVRAGLSMSPAGPVFWRGRTPPRSYLPSGAYL